MNPNKGKPSSTIFDPGVACSAGRFNENVVEPFACPVNLDEERDATASSRPNNAARASVERREDANLKPAPKPPPNAAFHSSFGALSSLPSSTAPRKQEEGTNITRASVLRRDDANQKPAPKLPPNPSFGMLSSLTSYTVPRKKDYEEEELSFPFVVDKHPTHSNVACMPNPSINTTTGVSPSLAMLLPSQNNQSGHQPNARAKKVSGQNLDYFAEIAHPRKHQPRTLSPKALSQPQIVNTPLGLAVLLNHDGCKPPTRIPGTIHRGPTNTRPPSNTMQCGPTYTTGANQQSQPQEVSSDFAWVGADRANGGASPRRFQRWSPEEDHILKAAVESERGQQYDWKRIASNYFGIVRSAAQCKSRWTKFLKPGIVRGAWTAEEDACILKYRQEGLGWTEIAGFLPGRVAEKIGSRYKNFLDPSLKKTPWTPEEDLILFQEQRRHGNKWTRISQLLPGRSEGSVKNRWHNLKATRQRRMRQDARLLRQDAKQLKCRNELMGLKSNGDNMEERRLLARKLRLLEMAKMSSIPKSDTKGVAMVPEQKRLEEQIQSLQLGTTRYSAAPPKRAPREIIEILDDDDDDDED